jgi:hypothetical protein
MPRIRTIKPEFAQSESMGRVSREARLLFVLLWTQCDDSGRTRAASRMLASLLYPYDEDAPELIDGWLAELDREGCIVRYQVDGDTYLEVAKWLKHQKIDRPSKSKLPDPREGSRVFAEASRKFPQDLGPRTRGPRTITSVATQRQQSGEQQAGLPSSGDQQGPLDLKRELFERGLNYLLQTGMPEPRARAMLGKWRKTSGDAAILDVLARSEAEIASDPVAFITKTLEGKPRETAVGVTQTISKLMSIATEKPFEDDVF